MEANVLGRELGPLLNLNYQRLQTVQSPSDPEVLKLFDAIQGLGFFYLDLREQNASGTSVKISPSIGQCQRLVRNEKFPGAGFD
jgi:hypothetical protein